MKVFNFKFSLIVLFIITAFSNLFGLEIVLENGIGKKLKSLEVNSTYSDGATTYVTEEGFSKEVIENMKNKKIPQSFVIPLEIDGLELVGINIMINGEKAISNFTSSERPIFTIAVSKLGRINKLKGKIEALYFPSDEGLNDHYTINFVRNVPAKRTVTGAGAGAGAGAGVGAGASESKSAAQTPSTHQ